MKVGIIGAGSAGIAVAQIIAQAGVEAVLFSNENVAPYHKSSLLELAFGDEELNNVFIHPPEWYTENGIDLRLDAQVKSFNSDFEVTLGNGEKEKFNALVITTGASPVIPPFANKNELNDVFPLASYSDAIKINKRLKSSKHIAIIGGGLIGVEAALRAENKGLNVTIIEKEAHLMSRYFGPKASKVIESQLHKRNIDFLLDNNVCRISKTKNYIELDLEDKDSFLCDFAILVVGSTFDTTMAVEAGLKTDTQIVVDDYLQTSLPGIFAAGDIAQLPVLRPCSAKEALLQAEIAGKNVLAYLNSKELQAYEYEPTPIQLKYKDFEAYSVGVVAEDSKKEFILDFDLMKIYRACVYENCALAGVQMVGTDKDFAKYHKELLLEKVWQILNHKIFLV